MCYEFMQLLVSKFIFKKKKSRKMWGRHAKNFVGKMHESRGQHIGRASSRHLFHTTDRKCMYGSLSKASLHFMAVTLSSGHFLLQLGLGMREV